MAKREKYAMTIFFNSHIIYGNKARASAQVFRKVWRKNQRLYLWRAITLWEKEKGFNLRQLLSYFLPKVRWDIVFWMKSWVRQLKWELDTYVCRVNAISFNGVFENVSQRGNQRHFSHSTLLSRVLKGWKFDFEMIWQKHDASIKTLTPFCGWHARCGLGNIWTQPG